jgi:phenylalanyl-tRNA synthetase beta chain
MTISYNWLSEYLPVKIEPEKLSGILTAIGLEVENLAFYEEVKGGLQGLVTGEVISCTKHPDADKLSITTVSTGQEKLLQIVCGAPNVAAGQKVIVAPVGCTIYPLSGEPFTIRKAKIRGIDSEGMICAEDEIGLGQSHDGIKILPEETKAGLPLTGIFQPYSDHIFEIGLTPNRMDAMSHLGVAKDICAWLSYHNRQLSPVTLPYPREFVIAPGTSSIEVVVENTEACKRYSGMNITGITVTDSPKWLQQKLKSIGLKPINNIVDITNFILHETGQPLHAFDADKITGNKIMVTNVPDGTPFKTLDDKDRTLSSSDLMICNAAAPMCIAGVYGGAGSGVTTATKNIFLESAWFNPVNIRRTSVKHDLRTDAAARFEKGTDISNTVDVLKRACLMILDLAGGTIAGKMIDIYPDIPERKKVTLPFNYLKKLSGKHYPPADVKTILLQLGFEITRESTDEIEMKVPYSKPDISIPADIVEEIMRIDGLDNIEIPATISITPSVEKDKRKYELAEKLADYLTGLGFFEIFTNSISNSAFYDAELLSSSVKMINSLSADLDMLRPQMLQSGLQVIAHNLNRKNPDLRMYEFGKTYAVSGEKNYTEKNHLCFYVSGSFEEPGWKIKPQKADFYYLKGVLENILTITGIKKIVFDPLENGFLKNGNLIKSGNSIIGSFGEVQEITLKRFDIKSPVFFADLDWDEILAQKIKPIQYREISKFPVVNRDLAVVVDKNVSYNQVEQIALSGKIAQLQSVQLFDVFESDKLGAGKKSMAVSFTFLDETKTLTDKEIDSYMQKIVSAFETALHAEIRK